MNSASTPTSKSTQSQEHYVDLFAAQAPQGDTPAWLPALKKAALDRFVDKGFPDRRDESWRYVNLRPLVNEHYAHATSNATVDAAAIAPFHYEGLGCARWVFVDGIYNADLSHTDSLPAGITLRSMRQAMTEESSLPSLQKHFEAWQKKEHELYHADHAFGELNQAFFADGIYCHVTAGTVIEQPIEVIYYTTESAEPQAHYLRNVVVCESNSDVSFVETHAGAPKARGLSNFCTEFHVADNANVDHVKIQCEPKERHHVAQIRLEQGRDSNFFTHFFSFGGKVVRHEIEARMLGTGGDCHMTGAYVARDDSMVDNTTTLHHAVPHCHSREVYKGILADKSEGAFTGKIYVHQDAQKTDAEQSNDTLLLSDDASVNARPNLEIYADDVRCTHGATIGQINPESLFYLRARGIDRTTAFNMLTRAFAHEVFDGVRHDAVRERLDVLLNDALPGTPA